MSEIYSRRGSARPYISPQEIQSMLKNMKKVPSIQKQADLHHQQEQQEAEKLLKQGIEDSTER